jgi:hypothetical protein
MPLSSLGSEPATLEPHVAAVVEPSNAATGAGTLEALERELSIVRLHRR